jgi:hypothetical protein
MPRGPSTDILSSDDDDEDEDDKDEDDAQPLTATAAPASEEKSTKDDDRSTTMGTEPKSRARRPCARVAAVATNTTPPTNTDPARSTLTHAAAPDVALVPSTSSTRVASSQVTYTPPP